MQVLVERGDWIRCSGVTSVLKANVAVHERTFAQQRGAFQTTGDGAEGTFVNPTDAPHDHGPKERVVETMTAQPIRPDKPARTGTTSI